MPVQVPFYQVKVEGSDITPWVSAVTYVEDDKQADSVTISIPDPRMIYADGLLEGSVAELDMGYTGSQQHALVIRAIITKVELSYPQNGEPVLTLKGSDRSVLMGLTQHNKRWHDSTVTDIVRKVAAPYGFAQIQAELNSDPMIKSRPIHQNGKTDLAFLQDLARTYHAKCFVELDADGNEILYFIPERRVVTLNRPDTPVLRYRTGPDSNLVSFSPAFDSSYIDRLKQVSDVDQQGNNVSSQDRPPPEIVIWDLSADRLALANARDRTLIQALYDKGSTRKRDLQDKLAARYPAVGEVASDQADIESTNDSLESRRLGMSASASTFGNIWLRAKSNVLVDGVSERFNGEWYVSSATQKIGNGSFTTDFKCVR